ncbi:MAG: UDP-N-acetylmuramate--L-alanine ligase [Microgenomates group bacterium]
MLNQSNNIFIVGIKGVAMANLALILKKMGKNVGGSDVEEEFITDELLKKNKISWQAGFGKLPDGVDLVIYSAAHGGVNNPQVIEAKKRGIKILSQAQVLGKIMEKFKKKIAVCGSHGKTTTASLLAYSLIKLGEKPSYLVGSSNFNHFWGGDYQKSDYFVVEADEYGVNPPADKTPKFYFLNPDYIISTNIDFDHPDVYKNIEETRKAFIKFFNNKKLILNIDNVQLFQCFKTLKYSKLITYGFSKKADYQIINWEVNEQGSTFTLLYHPKQRNNFILSSSSSLAFKNNNLVNFKISLFGKHNISNAAAVIAQLLLLGFKPDEIKKAMLDFKGARRRFEVVYQKNNQYLIDDYAHHPNEIKATIKAAKLRFPKRKIMVIFQPHTYSRTLSLLEDFAKSLSYADKALILPIFPSAREKGINFKISSAAIAKLNPDKLIYISSKNQLLQVLSSFLDSQEIIFTMGAGDVYKLKDDIIKIISNAKS